MLARMFKISSERRLNSVHKTGQSVIVKSNLIVPSRDYCQAITRLYPPKKGRWVTSTQNQVAHAVSGTAYLVLTHTAYQNT